MLPLLLAAVGLQVAGTVIGMSGASQAHQSQQQITQLEMQQDQTRRQMMEITARRQQMEVLRNQQRARSLALAAAVNQGASFGSGLAGGYGQIAGQTNTNLTAIGQNLAAGRHMFDLNAQISQQRMNISDAQSTMAMGQGISSIGSAIGGSMGPMGNILGNFQSLGNPMGNAFNPNGPLGVGI
jgi:hypothetical protein